MQQQEQQQEPSPEAHFGAIWNLYFGHLFDEVLPKWRFQRVVFFFLTLGEMFKLTFLFQTQKTTKLYHTFLFHTLPTPNKKKQQQPFFGLFINPEKTVWLRTTNKLRVNWEVIIPTPKGFYCWIPVGFMNDLWNSPLSLVGDGEKEPRKTTMFFPGSFPANLDFLEGWRFLKEKSDLTKRYEKKRLLYNYTFEE